jgi:hypothetical protein
VELKHVLGEIKTDRGNLHLDGSPHVIRLQRSPYGTAMPGAGVVHHIRSKWSRVLRYVKMEKDEGEALAAFIKRKGGINECVVRYSRCLRRLAATRRSIGAFQRRLAGKR